MIHLFSLIYLIVNYPFLHLPTQVLRRWLQKRAIGRWMIRTQQLVSGNMHTMYMDCCLSRNRWYISFILFCFIVAFAHLGNEASGFHSSVRSIFLTSEQEETLNIHYLPFFPGTKYCSVLLVCPEVYLLAASYI